MATDAHTGGGGSRDAANETNLGRDHPTDERLRVQLVNLAQAQDVEAGDGTTTVVVLCGALLAASQRLLSMGIHATTISDAFQRACDRALEVIESMAAPVNLMDRAALIKAATTALSSKVVSQYASLLAPIAVDAVLRVAPPAALATAADTTAQTAIAGADSRAASGVDLSNVRIIKKLGGTLEDTQLLPGLALTQRPVQTAGGPTRMTHARVALIQFCLSAPKTDIDNTVVVQDYASIDRVLREERQYTMQMCKRIKATGCNVLLVQKSILRDATNDLSLHFLAKMKIMVIRDVERDEVAFICKTLGCVPIAGLDTFTADKMAKVEVVEEVPLGGGDDKVVVFHSGFGAPVRTDSGDVAASATGGDGGPESGATTPAATAGAATPSLPNQAARGDTVTVLVRGSNALVLDEAERSLHDALCVARSLVRKRSIVPGGGAVEIEVSVRLGEYAASLPGTAAYCVRAYAEALETVPYTLAENAGLGPIQIVTELRRRHAQGERNTGISAKRSSAVADMLAEHVLQPTLVSTSAFSLATEAARMILKIDDIVMTR